METLAGGGAADGESPVAVALAIDDVEAVGQAVIGVALACGGGLLFHGLGDAL
jgi:hypothetical protein